MTEEEESKLQKQVFNYISKSLSRGRTYEETEISLLKGGIPPNYIFEGVYKVKKKGKVLVPKGIFLGLLLFSIVSFLILTVLLLLFLGGIDECTSDSECSVGEKCSKGNCLDVVGVLECGASSEGDTYNCITDL